MQNVVPLLRSTFKTLFFSAADKVRLRALLAESPPNALVMEQLRHQLFDWVEADMSASNARLRLRWLREALDLLGGSFTGDLPDQVYFSPGTSALEAILNFLRAATESLAICLFTVADDRITAEVVAAHRRGVRVRVLTDGDKAADTGSDVRRLAAAGIAVKVDTSEGHMHHKFAVRDGCQVLTGSYNWTRSAAAVNYENVLLTDEPGVVRDYLGEFERLWQALRPL